MSLNPKDIYFTQRNAANTAFDEVYVSGSNLVIQTDSNGNIVGLPTLPVGYSVVSASYSVTSSHALTASYVQGLTSGSVASSSYSETASYALTASYVAGLTSGSVASSSFSETASYALTASYVQGLTSGSVASASYAMYAATASYVIGLEASGSVASSSYSQTASYALKAESLLTGININVNQITASAIKVENLQVVTITSSIDYVSGSTIFGNSQNDTHQFTGSVFVSGSMFVSGAISGSIESASYSVTSSASTLNTTIVSNQTVGGISSGTTISPGITIEQILRQIFIAYIPPTLSSLTMRLGGSSISTADRDVNNSFQVNTASFTAGADSPNGVGPISCSWTASGADIGTTTYYFGNSALPAGSNILSVGNTYTINKATAAGTVTFTVNGRRSDTGAAISGTSTSVSFRFRNYMAASSTVISSNATAQSVIDNDVVTSALDTNKAWSTTCTAANDTAGNYTYIIYPASYGDLSGIIQNGALPVLTAFTKLGDYTITNAYAASISVRVYQSNSTQAFASGTTLDIS